MNNLSFVVVHLNFSLQIVVCFIQNNMEIHHKVNDSITDKLVAYKWLYRKTSKEWKPETADAFDCLFA